MGNKKRGVINYIEQAYSSRRKKKTTAETRVVVELT
jgi:hypothetical protein